MSAFTLHPVVLPSAIAVLSHEETIASSLYERSMHWRHRTQRRHTHSVFPFKKRNRRRKTGNTKKESEEKRRKKDKSGQKINKKREIG